MVGEIAEKRSLTKHSVFNALVAGSRFSVPVEILAARRGEKLQNRGVDATLHGNDDGQRRWAAKEMRASVL